MADALTVKQITEAAIKQQERRSGQVSDRKSSKNA
jgi:hypothetical protein